MLWLDILVAVAILWIPGYLCARMLRLPRTWAIVTAPLATITQYCLLAVAFSLVHVQANVVSLAAVPTVVLLLLFAVRHHRGINELELSRLEPATLFLVACIGLAITWLIFVRVLPYPEAINEDWDSVFHLGHIGAIMDSGDFVAGSYGQYATTRDLAVAPFRYHGWYPSGWHLVCALIAEATGSPPLITINALSVVCIAFVYPLSFVAFAAAAGFDNPRTQVAFGLASLSFVIFPWGFLVHGTLYPNLFSFCLVPAVTAVLFLALRHLPRLHNAFPLLTIFVLAAICLFFVHPGAIFTVGFFSVCGIAAAVFRASKERFHGSIPVGAAFVALWLAAVAGIWYACYKVLLHAGSLGGTYPSHYLTLVQAIKNAIRLNYADGFRDIAPQYVLAVFVISGAVHTFQQRRARWLVFSYLMCCAVFVITLVTDNPVHQLLGGFWYADPYRMGAQCALFAVPLAALGIDWLCEGALWLISHRGSKAAHMAGDPQAADLTRVASACITLCLFSYLNFASGWLLPTPTNYLWTSFETLNTKIRYHYVDHHVLSQEELTFASEVSQIVGDELVVNNPMDGSMFLYGTSGIRTYYRDYQLHQNESAASLAIRTELNQLAGNQEVGDAVQSVGAAYVLQLHADTLDQLEQVHEFDTIPLPYGAFPGITSVDETTPRFTLVLEEDDMRLYRIDAQ